MEGDLRGEISKIANILAFGAIQGMTKGEGSAALDACGFSTKEIAALVGTSEASVRALVSQGRKKRQRDDQDKRGA